MRFRLIPFLALAAAAVSHGAESPMDTMGRQMDSKATVHAHKEESGIFSSNRYPSMGSTRCKRGKAGRYGCKNIDVVGSLAHDKMGSKTRAGNDIWGWTSEDGREFALVGQTDGTAFVELIDGEGLKYLGRLPTQTDNAIWRDIKVIGQHAYISAESTMHGMQVFDLTKLLSIGSRPKIFNPKTDLTAHFTDVGSAHNVIANAETNTIFLSGGANATCKDLGDGGLMMIDVRDPSRPRMTGCAGQGGYVHDARCVTYRGPDARFHGREICFAANIHSFNVYDVTDPKNTVILSKNYYPGIDGRGAYTHQAWEVDASFRYMLMNDEQDEEIRDNRHQDARTTTYIWDMASLTRPVMTGTYKAPIEAIDHNLYVADGKAYMANYASGLRVVDVSRLSQDPTGRNMKELAYFDCWPGDDDEPEVAYYGAWSSYIWFDSGVVILNCIETGMFALRVNA